MVDQAHSREGAGQAAAPKEFRVEEQRWLAGGFRAIQGLDIESDYTSHETDDVRCPQKAFLEPTKGLWAH
jgi:hypothetical protein